jgi:hypothetical protein
MKYTVKHQIINWWEEQTAMDMIKRNVRKKIQQLPINKSH